MKLDKKYEDTNEDLLSVVQEDNNKSDEIDEHEDEPETDDCLSELGGLLGHYDYINEKYYDGSNNDYYHIFKRLCDMNSSYEKGYEEGYQEGGKYSSFDSNEKIMDEVEKVSDYLEVEWWRTVGDTTIGDREEDQDLLVGEWRRTDAGSNEIMKLWRDEDADYTWGKVTGYFRPELGSGDLEWHTVFETETGKLKFYMYFFEHPEDDEGETGVIENDDYYEYDRNTDSLVGIGKNKVCYERI